MGRRCPQVLRRPGHLVTKLACGPQRPVRVAQHLACEKHYIGLTAADDRVGLLRIRDHPHRARCDGGIATDAFGKRLLERVIGDARFSGTHERAPDGFLLAYGEAVAPARQARGAVVDVAPTLLAMMGLGQPAEMTGKSLLVRK